jgi:hypothetical protein
VCRERHTDKEREKKTNIETDISARGKRERYRQGKRKEECQCAECQCADVIMLSVVKLSLC